MFVLIAWYFDAPKDGGARISLGMKSSRATQDAKAEDAKAEGEFMREKWISGGALKKEPVYKTYLHALLFSLPCSAWQCLPDPLPQYRLKSTISMHSHAEHRNEARELLKKCF